MNKPFLSSLLVGLLYFSQGLSNENITCRLHDAEKGFQKRWEEFCGNAAQFPLWNPDWTEKELKERFDQIAAKRWEVYFINPEDRLKINGIGRYRTSYKTPKSFDSWGSRYAYPGSFDYNLANPHYNASIITLHGKQFLAMEGPTEENLNVFCQILDQYQVTDLVRLTPRIYKHRENSYPYWEGHLNIHPQNGATTIEIGEKERNYFQTDCWINRLGIAPQRLTALIKNVMSQESDSQMIAVHCRAGISRTGTFLAAWALVQEIDEQIRRGVDPHQIKVSIDQIIWELTLQRPFMVNHFSQYMSLYQLVNWYVEKCSEAS